MMKAVGLISMLHEGGEGENSGTRLFRGQPVLWWTLARLAAVGGVESWTVLCWGDQAEAAAACAGWRDSAGQAGHGTGLGSPDGAGPSKGGEGATYVGLTSVKVVSKGERVAVGAMDAVTAASRWLDGWRGGLAQTCDFDRGFHAGWVRDVIASAEADAAVVVDPAAGLVDPGLVSELVAHAAGNEDEGLVFSQGAPGLNGIVVRKSLVEQLVRAGWHPGKLLTYLQDQPGKDPIARPCCAPVPTVVARTGRRFKLDSVRQVRRLERECESLNGQLVRTGAEELVRLAEGDRGVDVLPREVTVELTTRRKTRPIWWAGTYANVERPEMELGVAERVFEELAEFPDTRVTFGGVGDALLHEGFEGVVEVARAKGLQSLHVETDLLGAAGEKVHRLAGLGVDVVSIHMPGVTQETYAKVMGVDGYLEVLENLKTLVAARAAGGRGVPLVVPTFVKCRVNLHEMEAWYDQWLRVLGSAVITAPTGFGGVVPAEEVGISHMAPPKRRACGRLQNRMAILADGRVVKCEEAVVGDGETVGRVGEMSMKQLWAAMDSLRQRHARGEWDKCGSCGMCQEWHRP